MGIGDGEQTRTAGEFDDAASHEVREMAAALAMLAAAACSRGADDAADAARLPKLPIDPATVTVSGISSGGAMATQFHVAHSNLVQGAGILASGPYRCAEGSVREALGRCMQGEPEIPTAQLVEQTRSSRSRRIDPSAVSTATASGCFAVPRIPTWARKWPMHSKRTTGPSWHRRTSRASSWRARATPSDGGPECRALRYLGLAVPQQLRPGRRANAARTRVR